MFVTVADDCTCTTNVLVSVFAFGRKNPWSGSLVFAVYLWVRGIPWDNYTFAVAYVPFASADTLVAPVVLNT